MGEFSNSAHCPSTLFNVPFLAKLRACSKPSVDDFPNRQAGRLPVEQANKVRNPKMSKKMFWKHF
jgi:hypothetical protein